MHADVNERLFADLGKHYDLRPGLRTLNRRVSTVAYINKAGHFPWVEQPDDFRRLIAAFLSEASDGGK